MPININGYALSNPDQLTFGASATKIHAATYGIKVPTLPAMCGSCTAGGTPYPIAPLPVNDANVNVGSHWSTSTYRFTAPVAGVYYISYGGIVGDGATTVVNGYFSILLNGAAAAYSYHHAAQSWDLHHLEVQLKMQAGDYVSWAMNAAPGPAGGVSGAYRSNHNVETIWLVG